MLASKDGEQWDVIIDKSENRTDVPHDYVELPEPVEARHIKIENVHMPTGKFALSGLRVFGKGHGEPPAAVRQFAGYRGTSEPRNAWLKWQRSVDATGYIIRAGITPDKLYTSVMVFGANDYFFRALEGEQPHYFTIEAFNENGLGPRGEVVKVQVERPTSTTSQAAP